MLGGAFKQCINFENEGPIAVGLDDRFDEVFREPYFFAELLGFLHEDGEALGTIELGSRFCARRWFLQRDGSARFGVPLCQDKETGKLLTLFTGPTGL